MKTNAAVIPVALLLMFVWAGCSTHQNLAEEEAIADVQVPSTAKIPSEALSASEPEPSVPLEDEEGYRLRPMDIEIREGRAYLPVGAELVTKDGRVPLVDLVKKLAELRGFSVSWANDVKPDQLVNAHIRPEEDFWSALDNVLRQVDYFYEMEKETIVIKYKETKEYHLAMPFLQEQFSTSVGGDLLGVKGGGKQMKGQVEMLGEMKAPLDFWKVVAENLRIIIGAKESKERVVETSETDARQQVSKQQKEMIKGETIFGEKGYFIIDRPLGLITVTAPKKTQEAVTTYLGNLKDQIYKQVIIEAKIIEVTLNNASSMGIDWSDVLSKTYTGSVSFGGPGGVVHPSEGFDFIRTISLDSQGFRVMISALKTYGKTRILANPKISLLNGHGATITVGENVTYIDEVETTISTTAGSDLRTFTIDTSTVLSGVGLGVMANIVSSKEVILYIVPITSDLEEPIEYRQFGGAEGAEGGLPRIKLRNLATLSKVEDGRTLIIGGLIDKTETKDVKKAPWLGDLPFLGNFFRHEDELTNDRELVILLKPRIMELQAGL